MLCWRVGLKVFCRHIYKDWSVYIRILVWLLVMYSFECSLKKEEDATQSVFCDYVM